MGQWEWGSERSWTLVKRKFLRAPGLDLEAGVLATVDRISVHLYFSCKEMSSEGQLPTVGRQPSRIGQLSSDVPPPLPYLYKGQPCCERSQFLSLSGPTYLLGDFF